MDDSEEAYKAALKRVEELLKKQQALNKSTERLKESWEVISSQIFKLDGAAFFKQIPLSQENIKRLNEEIKTTNDQIKALGKEFGEALDSDKKIQEFQTGFETAYGNFRAQVADLDKDSDEYYKHQIEYLNLIRDLNKDIASLSDDELLKMGKYVQAGGALSGIYSDLSDEAKDLVKSSTNIADKLIDSERAANDLADEVEKARKKLADGSREAFSLGAGLKAAFKENVFKGGLGALMEFDRVLNDVQKNTGIAMDTDANSATFAGLTTRVSQFGMSAEKAGQMMSAMSNELDTTNFSVLSKATEDFAAIEGATSASAEEITTIAGQLMRMGASSSDVKEYMQDASNMARRFGVNSKKAMSDISRNITKMRSMGFAGGEESLTKMVIQAQKLNKNIDEVFNVAERARAIEGAMEMASQLQLAGGSFANINPMDLLAAARNSPEELQKILNQMGSEMGKFNEKTGMVEFSASDKDRLQMVADATGQTLEDIMDGIQKSKIDADKLQMFDGMLNGLSEADKALAESSLSDMMKWDAKQQKFVLDADNNLAKKMGITNLEDLSEKDIKAMIEKKKADDALLEKQNLRNQNFQEALTNFWGALQSMFALLEPIITALTSVMQTVTMFIAELPGWGKWLVGSLLAAFALFGTSVGAFILKGVGGFAKGVLGVGSLFKKGGMASLGDKIKEKFTGKSKVESTELASKAKGPAPTVGAGLKSLAQGLKAMGKNFGDVAKGIATVALAGPAFLLFTPALPGLMVMALAGTLSVPITAGFQSLSKGFQSMGKKFGDVALGATALTLASLAFITFIPTLPGLMVMALAGTLSVPITAGFQSLSKGFQSMGKKFGDVALGAAALSLVGISLLLFTVALPGLLVLSLAGLLIAPILLGFTALTTGFSMLGAAFPLVALGAAALALIGVAMLAVAGSILIFAMAGQMISKMGFGWLSDLGWSLLTATPGLILGGASLLIATPGLIFGSIGLMAIAGAAMVASQVDWTIIANMGNALLMASGGLLAFSLSALMFANPIALFGMMIMVSSIAALAAVMIPLSLSLQLGADSMTKFAIGLERLSAAADALSDEKLAKLQKISDAMAKASAAGNIAAATAATAEAAGGGAGGAGGGTRKLEIDIKMNGRDVAYTINKDTQIVK